MLGITAPFNVAFLQEKMLTIAAFDLVPGEVLNLLWGYTEKMANV
jgi:hypothetical protein